MRVLVVDDEPLARRGLRREVERLPGWSVVADCATRDEAIAGIATHRPDIVLLDVQLGRSTGFEVIESFGVDDMPPVVFVTAYDRHAVRAFEVHAVDYVLKPVDPERLREALGHAARQRRLAQGPALAERLQRVMDQRSAPVPDDRAGPPIERLAVRDGARVMFVAVDQVDWIEAWGNRVRVHASARTHVLRGTMANLQESLGSGRFIRIRRSALVNVRAIEAVEPFGKGTFLVTLRNGTRIVSSRYQLSTLRALLRPLR